MDSSDIQERSPLVILPLKSDHDQIRDLEKMTDELIAATTKVTVRVTACDDPALEGDTLVEDLTTAPVSDAKSTFNGKEWIERLARTDIFESQARSRSCTGRIQGNTITGTSLHKAPELHQDGLEKQLLCSEDCSERLKTLEGSSEDLKNPPVEQLQQPILQAFDPLLSIGVAPNTVDPHFLHLSPIQRGRSSLRSMGLDQSQVALQTPDIHRDTVIPESPNQDQKETVCDHIDEQLSEGQQDQCPETIVTDGSATDSIPALGKFDEIFPQAKQWFDKVPNKCLWQKATKAKNDRCNNPIPATHKNMIEERFETLRNMCFPQHILEAGQFIGELADLAFCSRHHCRKARARIQESLAGSLLQSQGESILSSIKCEGEDDISHKSIDKLRNTSPFRRGARSANIPTAPSRGPVDDCFNFRQGAVLRQHLRRRAVTTHCAYIPKFVRYETRESRAVADHGEWILKKANKEFTKLELKKGYIYAYWNRTTFGDYKIGFTTKDVDERLRKWESKCKHEAERIYPPRDGVAILMPHVKRVELLIHADLIKCRYVEKNCRGCHQSHDEWFRELNESLLKAKIEKWTDWIMSKPYEESGGNLVLRKSAEDTLIEMCRESANSQTNVSLQVPAAKLP